MIKVMNAYKNTQSHAHDVPRTVAVEGAWLILLIINSDCSHFVILRRASVINNMYALIIIKTSPK